MVREFVEDSEKHAAGVAWCTSSPIIRSLLIGSKVLPFVDSATNPGRGEPRGVLGMIGGAAAPVVGIHYAFPGQWTDRACRRLDTFEWVSGHATLYREYHMYIIISPTLVLNGILLSTSHSTICL
jgi:hypothetical protein